MIRRVLIVGAVWTATWWSLVGLLAAPVVAGGWLTIAAAATVAYLPLLVLVRRFRGAYPSSSIRLWVFRPFWYLQLGVLVSALSGTATALAAAPFGAGLRAGRWGLLLAGLAFGVLAIVGYVGSRWLTVRRLEARFPALPPGLDGLRIVQLSDLHVGPHTSRRYLARVRQAVEQLHPDLIAITGDQVDDYAGDALPFASAFAGMRAPLGVFAVAGNHDVYAGWPAVRIGLEAAGMVVLVNEAVPIGGTSARFWLAGTGDPAASGPGPAGSPSAAPDISRALSRIPADAFVVAMAHNPLLWPELARRGVQLTLSGHTHYGQLAIRAFGWCLASLFLEHAMGWHRRGGSLLYINPGTNYWGLPLRVGAWPEVTLVTLRRAEASEPSLIETHQAGPTHV